MKADENLRRDLVAAWEEATTIEDALVSIQQVIEKYTPALTKIEDREWSGGWGNDRNPYYNPAACGLELLAVAQDDEPYQFDMVCLWRDLESGRFFMAQDAGCSCPSPFENVTSVSDLTEVTTAADAQKFLISHGGSYTADSLFSMLKTTKEELPRW